MSAEIPSVRQVQGYCSLCIARCGTVATVTDGRFTRLDPDPTHPTGAAICAKGRAAPELVYHKDRLKRPLRRTRPKGDPVRAWSNGPLLVRSDTGRLLKAEDLASGGGSGRLVAWDLQANRTVNYDPAGGHYEE